MSLINSLQTRQCVLVVGPELPALRGQAEENLRDAFCKDLQRQLEEERHPVRETTLFAIAQQYQEASAFASINLRNLAAEFFTSGEFNPGPVHHLMANLPFSLILTTCHDDHMYRALLAADKQPARYRYHFNGEPRDNPDLPSESTPQHPTIYHLFGDALQEPASLVLTENDLMDFMIRVISARPKLPDRLRTTLRNKTLLFIGFGVRQWYIRVLLKLLLRTLDLAATSLALDPDKPPDEQEREQTILFYRRGTRLEVVEANVRDFLDECHKRLAQAGGLDRPISRLGKRPQVFISYERSDGELARGVFDALPRSEFDVFLDSELLAGEDWNTEIEDKIKTCDYFVVLNSPQLVAKKVGYVNKEIALAIEQQLYRQRGALFILPLIVSPLEPQAGLPDFRHLHQIPLTAGNVAADTRALASAMLRDFQRRGRMQ